MGLLDISIFRKKSEGVSGRLPTCSLLVFLSLLELWQLVIVDFPSAMLSLSEVKCIIWRGTPWGHDFNRGIKHFSLLRDIKISCLNVIYWANSGYCLIYKWCCSCRWGIKERKIWRIIKNPEETAPLNTPVTWMCCLDCQINNRLVALFSQRTNFLTFNVWRFNLWGCPLSSPGSVRIMYKVNPYYCGLGSIPTCGHLLLHNIYLSLFSCYYQK